MIEMTEYVTFVSVDGAHVVHVRKDDTEALEAYRADPDFYEYFELLE